MKIQFFGRHVQTLIIFLALAFFLAPADADAVRLKDIASVKGVRNNQLIGFGLVVGLDGTGDGKQTGFTSQGLINVMKNMGVHVNKDDVNVKNVAGVMVTAQLPPFVKAGQTIDVILSSIGDCSSLQGGTLITTSLKGLDKKVYAIAQGPISIGGFAVSGGATTGIQKNHLTVARIPDGATVEREVALSFAGKDEIVISLNEPDFTTVSRAVEALNSYLGGEFARAQDGATVVISVPDLYRDQEVMLLAGLENVDILPDVRAKVVLDERTGTVVMGENVRISRLALSHGNLSLQIGAEPGSAARSGLKTPTTEELLQSPSTEDLLLSQREVVGEKGSKVMTLPAGVSLGEVVRALNSVGITPRDLIAIFHSIKAAGALQADLEII